MRAHQPDVVSQPDGLHAYVAAFFSFYVEGTLDESHVHPTVQQILNRRPRTFEPWARAHAEAFR